MASLQYRVGRKKGQQKRRKGLKNNFSKIRGMGPKGLGKKPKWNLPTIDKPSKKLAQLPDNKKLKRL